MQISFNDFNTLFMCAIFYLVARRIYDKFREARGISKPSSNINLQGLFWPYIKAVIAGAAFAFVMWEFIPGSPIEEMAGNGLSSWMVRLAVMMSIIPLVMITTPFIILAGIGIRALNLRRGVSDIATGVIGATLGPLGSALFSPQPMPLSEAIPFVAAFPFAGAIGGFVFWRAVGYPGLNRQTARTIERTRSGAGLMSDVAGGSVLSAGLTARKMLRDEAEEDVEQPIKPRRRARSRAGHNGFGRRVT